MSKFFKILFLFCAFAISVNAQEDCMIENQIFYPGEKITFEGAYNWGPVWLRAGEATFALNEAELDGKALYHLVGEGKTFESYNWVYRVEDVYQSYIDKETLLPYKFIRDVDEGGHIIQNRYTFNHKENLLNIDQLKTNDHLKKKDESMYIPDCTHDVLSAVFYVRNIDYTQLEIGESVAFKIMIDAEVFNVSIVYHGIEEKKIKGGERYNCHKITFELIAGTIFEDGQTMTVWATADKNKIPVMVESPLIIGKAKFFATAYEGLQYPMEAKIEK